MENQESQSTAYFTFKVNDACYGVDALIIQEVVLLPEITSLEEAPPYILGAINLRGKTVPVLNLAIRLGRDDPGRCGLSDSLIIIEYDGALFSIVANEILEIVNLPADRIEQAPSFGDWKDKKAHVISGIGWDDDQMIMILDKDYFFESVVSDVTVPEDPQDLSSMDDLESAKVAPMASALSFRDMFCSETTEEDKAQFHARAERLKSRLESENRSGLKPVAIIELAGECFGVELDSVQGFSQRGSVTPIPCCPAHIVGNMNLRGDSITIVDIRAQLNLPISYEHLMHTIMVLSIEGQSVGVAIHQVMDVIHVGIDELSKVPVASGNLDRKHLKGLAPYGDRLLVIVDLRRLLSSPELMVNEEV